MRRTLHIRALLLALAATLVCMLASCEVLQDIAEAELEQQSQVLQPLLPTVNYEGATLVQAPSQAQMAAYYCPQVVPDPLGIPGAAAVACDTAFGAPPPLEQMRVGFDLRFKISNPNQFPVPVAELLTAATVFPDKTQQSLGAVCVAFCGASQPNCNGEPGPDACRPKESDIKSIEDFRHAAANLLIAKGIRVLSGEEPSFKMPSVVEDSELTMTMRFSFGPQALLGVMKEVAKQSISQLENGQAIQFLIPYSLQGTVFVDVGELGRAAVAFGPATGTWEIPKTALIP